MLKHKKKLGDIVKVDEEHNSSASSNLESSFNTRPTPACYPGQSYHIPELLVQVGVGLRALFGRCTWRTSSANNLKPGIISSFLGSFLGVSNQLVLGLCF